MSPDNKVQVWGFLEVIGVCQGALLHIHFYLTVLILMTQIFTSYGHAIGTYSQDLPIDQSSISGSPSVKTSRTYVDSLSVMFLKNVPVAIVVNSKGQIVGTLSSESFKATAQQTHAKIPSLTVKTQSVKSVAVKNTSVSKTNKDGAVSAASKEITVVKPNGRTKARTSSPNKMITVSKAISVKEAAAKVIVSQNSSSLKAKALNTNEPVAVLNNSAGAGTISAKTTEATNLEMTSLSPPAKMMASTGVQNATNITMTTTAAGNVTRVTQRSASTTYAPANTTVLLANTTVLPTNITSPTPVAAAFLEGLEYGEDYTTTPAPAPLLMGEGGEPLEPEEVIAAEPIELR